jgi:hypothetical protein
MAMGQVRVGWTKNPNLLVLLPSLDPWERKMASHLHLSGVKPEPTGFIVIGLISGFIAISRIVREREKWLHTLICLV